MVYKYFGGLLCVWGGGVWGGYFSFKEVLKRDEARWKKFLKTLGTKI